MTMTAKSKVTRTENLNYKNGFVRCACGWNRPLGNGFNGYHIDICPQCTAELETRNQRKVITGKVGSAYLAASIGSHTYFVLDNGIHIQFSKNGCRTITGLTEKQADRL